jgi:hypothetical protein
MRSFQKKTILVLIALCLISSIAFGKKRKNSIQVIGQIGEEYGTSFTLTKKMMEENSTTYMALDPNFKDDGINEYTGITIKKIIELAGVKEEVKGVTFVANNAYATYERLETVMDQKVMIAFKKGKKKIRKSRGGPFMVMREKTGDEGYYNWYIDTIIFGNKKNPELTVVDNGKVNSFDPQELSQLPLKTNNSPVLSRGYREDVTPYKRDAKATGALLTDIINMKEVKKMVVLTPYAGKSVKLKKEDIKNTIIFFNYDKKEIPSYYGGSFVVEFPEGYKETNLFFLERVEVK